MASRIIKFGGSITYHEDYHQLDKDDYVHLCEMSQGAIEHANAPYSNFKVGAAILLDDKSVVIGNNQENAVYPLGLCAERVALFSAASQFPANQILALAVATKKVTGPEDLPAFPCGSCRQVIHEYEQKQETQIPLLIVGSDNAVCVIDSVALILPFAFGRDNL